MVLSKLYCVVTSLYKIPVDFGESNDDNNNNFNDNDDNDDEDFELEKYHHFVKSRKKSTTSALRSKRAPNMIINFVLCVHKQKKSGDVGVHLPLSSFE